MKPFDSIYIDGNNLANKNYFTHQGLSVEINEKEFNTGLAYGFLFSLIVLRRDYLKSDGQIVVVWDRGHQRKLEIFPEYKKKRKEKRKEPKNKERFKDYVEQRNLLEEFLKVIRVSTAFAEGEEADDVIATLAFEQKKKKKRTLIVSSDKDFYQMIDDNIWMMFDRDRFYNPRRFKEKFGFHPKHYLAFQLLDG